MGRIASPSASKYSGPSDSIRRAGYSWPRAARARRCTVRASSKSTLGKRRGFGNGQARCRRRKWRSRLDLPGRSPRNRRNCRAAAVAVSGMNGAAMYIPSVKCGEVQVGGHRRFILLGAKPASASESVPSNWALTPRLRSACTRGLACGGRRDQQDGLGLTVRRQQRRRRLDVFRAGLAGQRNLVADAQARWHPPSAKVRFKVVA